MLVQAASGENPHAIVDLVRRFRQQCAVAPAPTPQHRRTAGELLAVSDRRREEKQCSEAERRRLEQERKEREQAAERAKHLDALEKREPESWAEMERLVATKSPNNYDGAVVLLADLRELADRKNCSAIYRESLRNLRARHAGKPSFIRKLNQAGLNI